MMIKIEGNVMFYIGNGSIMKSQMSEEMFSCHTSNSDYSGSSQLGYRQRQPPVYPPQNAIVPQQRHAPSLLPHLRHYGGCSHICCHQLWRKSRNSVALPEFAAVHFGDKITIFANKKRDEHTVLHPA